MRKLIFLLISALFASTLGTTAALPASEGRSILRFITATLSNTQADRILADATNVLAIKDNEADITCRITIYRRDDVNPFHIGNGTIMNNHDLQAVFGRYNDIRVVNFISYCGGKTNPSIVGCAQTSGGAAFNSIIVERTARDVEGILWAHEFLHTYGLGHRKGSCLVMNDTLLPHSREINDTECQALQPGFSGPGLRGQEDLEIAGQHNSDSTLAPVGTLGMGDVLYFVRQIYVHGIPFERAREFSSRRDEVVPLLLKALREKYYEQYVTNIATVLGIVGGSEARDGLMEYIEGSRNKQLSAGDYRGSLAAIVSLGYIVNQEEDKGAVQFLSELALGAGKSEESDGPATQSAEESGLTLDSDVIARSAVLGLALGGTAESKDVLESLLEPGQSESYQKFVESAVATNRMIARHGLVEYYKLERE